MGIIRVTKPAIQHLKAILNEHKSKYIYFGLKSGGCSGFEYIIEPTNASLKKNDELVNIENIPILVCGNSMMYCMGTEIKWEKTVMGEGFVFNNPLSKSTCGCGLSFKPKLRAFLD